MIFYFQCQLTYKKIMHLYFFQLIQHVLQVLKQTEGISFTFFAAKDVVRHPLVQRIVIAYEQYDKQQAS